MKTTSTNNCQDLTKNSFKNLARGTRMFLMLLLLVVGSQFYANAQQGLPAANITGPLVVCVSDTTKQSLQINVYSSSLLVAPNGITITLVNAPTSAVAFLDPVAVANIINSPNPWVSDGGGYYHLNPSFDLHVHGGNIVGACVVNLAVQNQVGWNYASKSLTIIDQNVHAVFTPILCYGGLSTITAIATPAFGEHVYNINSVPPQSNTTGTFIVPAGTYVITAQQSDSGVVFPSACIGDTTITITEPAYNPVVLNCPLDESHSACEYADQTSLNTAFNAWFNSFGYSGGTNPVLTITPSVPVAPILCNGGTITVTWSVAEDCAQPSSCTRTFTITAPSAVIATAPVDYSNTTCALGSQVAIDDAFAIFVGQFGVSGGCNPSGSVDELLTAPLLCTGGTVTVTYNWSDLCESGQKVATFTIIAPSVVTANAPSDYSNTSCALGTQAAIDAAFTTFLSGFNVSGGCTPSGSYGQPTAPALCQGGTITVTYNWSDLCENGQKVATFTIIAPSAVTATAPNDYSNTACVLGSQAAVDAAFTTFLNGFGVSGGCNATGSYGQPTAPVLCQGGTVTVTYNWSDLCENGQKVATFTIIAPPAVTATAPADYSNTACDLGTQAAIDAAFATFLNGFGVSGGCNPSGSVDELLTAPLLCTGGTVTVTYNWSDLCESGQKVAYFTITAPSPVIATQPNDASASACIYTDQAAIDAAFATWLTGFGVSGGCAPTGYYGQPTAPALCAGGTTTVTYSYSDICAQTSTITATFTIIAPPALVVNVPADFLAPAATYPNQAAADAAFALWLNGFSVTGGCSPSFNHGNEIAPLYCGGSTEVTWTVTDKCYNTTIHVATFAISAPPVVIVNPVSNLTTPASIYADQAAADAAFALWLSGFSVSGGINPQFTIIGSPVAPYYCGGSIEVTWEVTDFCYNTTIHKATFEITPPPPVNVTEVLDVTILPCTYVDQTAADAAFATWLNGFSVSGGISPQFTYGSPVAPAYCGGSTSVTWTVTDRCYVTTMHTATFTISAPSAVIATAPADYSNTACVLETQAAVDLAFATFINGFSVSGGCSPAGSVDELLTAPLLCTGGTVTVTYNWSDLCESGQKVATFSIIAPSAVTATAPANYSNTACALGTQAAIDAAFTTFLNGFSLSGGCNPSGSVDELLTAPLLCTGGSVTVTYNWSDLCESGQKVAIFTIIAPSAVIATAPADYSNTDCALGSQAAIDAAFATFLNGFSVSGGCNPSGSVDELLTAPLLCTGGTVTVTYNWSDLCESGTKVATFTIISSPVILNCGTDVIIPACPTQSAVNAAYAAFKSSVTVSGGCNGSLTNNAPLCPPDKCGGSITVTWTYTGICPPIPNTCTKTFTVTPAPPVELICGNNVTVPACSDQATINAAWQAFLASTTASGGCNGVLTNNAPSCPPPKCGGSVYVTWTYTSECDNGLKCTGHTCTKKFTVASAPPVVFNCGINVTIPACPSQSALNAAYASFIASTTASGGCNGVLTNNAPLNPPDICGGYVYVKWTYTSDCDCPKFCIKKFTVLPAPEVVLNCGNNKTVPACSNQATVDAAWAIFLASTTATGGCNGVMTNNAPANPPSICGGSVSVTWTYNSSCDNGQKCTGNTCTRTFTVLSAPPVVFNCGANKTVSACSSQSAINTAWTCFLASTTASGGCNGSLTNNATNPPDKCVGGSVDVTWTYTSSCEVTRTCTRTFTVIPAPAIVFNCGTDVVIPACPSQTAVNAAYAAFKASTTASGGCNGSLTNNAPLCPPDKCGGSVDVTWTYTSSCGTRTCTKTFTVTPAPPVAFNCGNDVTVPACSDQATINAAWANFLASTTASGGCNGNLSNNAPSNPPPKCGGHVHVTWTYTSDCDNGQKCTGRTCTKTFTVASAPPVVLNCGIDVTIPACPTPQALSAAYAAFIASTTASGGCNGVLTNNAPANPPDVCGGCVYVKWTYTSACANPVTCTKKFTVLPAPEVVLNCGNNVTVPACSDQATVDAAWVSFLASTTATGGCNGVMTNNAPANPPSICGGSVSVTWTYNSSCNSGQKCTGNTCTRTFTVLSAPPVVLNCGANKTVSACPDQTIITTAWNNFLASTTASGGCNGSLTNNATNLPNICGGSVDVTWTYTSSCDVPQTCTRTFTIEPAPQVVLNCGNNVTIPACPGTSALNAAYIAFKNSASASGGCNGILSTLAPLCPPDICGGSVDVTWTYTSSCDVAQTCTRTLTVNPSPPVEFICGNDVTLPSCSDQATINTAWANFLASTTASGGCNGILVHNAPPNTPNPCGDYVYVTWTYHTPCDDGQKSLGYTCTRTFIVESPINPLNVNKPADYTALAINFTNQAAVNAAFANWLNGFNISGGCAPTASYGTPSAPNLNTGGTTTVTYNYTDVCTDASFLTAKFTINLSSSITNPTTSTDPWTPTLDPMNIDLNIAPNPFTDQTNINFTLSEDSKVSVEIFNITGAKIATIYEGQIFANESNTFKYVPELRGNQVLLCIIRTPNGIAQKRMVLVR